MNAPAVSTVRAERAGDEEAIRAVHAACFPALAEAGLVDALRATGRLSFSFVAVVDGEMVGHVGFSPVSAGRGEVGLGLAPLAVLAANRRRGIGAGLCEAGLTAAREAGCGWVVVLGDPHYYGRFGFRPASRFGLTSVYHAGDHFQALELRPGALPAGAGLVRYAEEFAELG